MPERMGRILIIGNYGARNTGDDAMLAGLIAGRGVGLTPQFVVATKDITQTSAVFGAKAQIISANSSSVLRALIQTRNLALGGGTHFHDDYTFVRYLRHLIYMARIVSLTFLAKLLGGKVAWLSMGFGPFFRRPTRILARIGLALCDCITVRDEKSWREIAAWVPSEKLTLTFDVAALLMLGSRPTSRMFRASDERKILIGISATSIECTKTGCSIANDLFWREVENALVAVFSAMPCLAIRIFIVGSEKRKDDTAISNRIYESLSRVDHSRVEILGYQPDPLDTLIRMSECQALIASRFHAALLAYLAGCDLLLIAYHRKLKDLAEELMLSPEACISITSDFSAQSLQMKIEELIRGEPWMKPQLSVHEAVNRAMLNLDFLRIRSDHLHDALERAEVCAENETLSEPCHSTSR